MDIIVCIKQVPDPDAPADTFKIDREQKRVIPPPNVDPVITLYDEHAIEAALQLKEQHGGKVTVLSMGPDSVQRAIKQALAMGADEGYHLNDEAFLDADAYTTAYALAQAIKKLGRFDLILCGRQASDWDQGQVGVGIAEFLGIPSITLVVKAEVQDSGLRVERLVEGGYEVIETSLPALLTVSSEMNKPRYPTLKGIMAAGRKKVPVWGASDLGIDTTQVGAQAALMELRDLYIPQHEGQCEFIEGETPEEIVENLARRLREAKII
ncbi:MAG: electron transfer flavoprotein beta subunit/FixA family protein [Nitrospinota bacterium]|nr:MAG: electron transfer flavoprotein beta subunit/FixA family protein [Nitrospinota bacterium]